MTPEQDTCNRERVILMPAQDWEALLRTAQGMPPACGPLGYSSRRAYLRELRQASKIHGPRVQARMELAIAHSRRKR